MILPERRNHNAYLDVFVPQTMEPMAPGALARPALLALLPQACGGTGVLVPSLVQTFYVGYQTMIAGGG